MAQDSLFYESLGDALDAVVKALGGAKSVGGRLWPEKTPASAHTLMLACLNEARAEKFSPEQVLWLLAEGRKAGCHVAMNYLARETGYADPTPIEPDDEKARLQREFIEAQKSMQTLAARMERAGLLGAA